MPQFKNKVEIIKREDIPPISEIDYTPRIKDAKPQIDPKKFNFKRERLYRVTQILNENTIKLDTGLKVRLLGIKVENKSEAIKYLNRYVLKKDIFLQFDNDSVLDKDTVMAYVYLKNKIFVNAYLIKSGIASPDLSMDFKYKKKFIEIYKVNKYGKRMDIKYGYQ